MNRFEKQRKEMRKNLISSAISVFYEKGFPDTRIKDITDNANTSVGNFYHYFKNKEQLFDEIIESLYEILLVRLREVSKLNKIPRTSNLRNLIREYLNIFSDKEKTKAALLFAEQMGGISPKYLRKKRELLTSFKKEIYEMISRLLEIGFIRDQNTDLTSHIWQTVILESFVWWINSDKKISEEELIDNVLNFLIKGTVTK
ncbi:MAG: TetR/AcrR family transcriptional regulator [Promethearchaeia archaeon]